MRKKDRVQIHLRQEVRRVVLEDALFHCVECGKVKSASEFGLRVSGDVVRNHQQCKGCREKQLLRGHA